MSEITERMREIAIAGLEADLREERERIAAMRVEWGAEIAALTERIESLTAERDFAMSHWASAATAYENLSRKTDQEA